MLIDLRNLLVTQKRESFQVNGASPYLQAPTRALLLNPAVDMPPDSSRAGLRHVRRVRPNRVADFRGPPFWMLRNFCINYVG